MNLIQIDPKLDKQFTRLKQGWVNCHNCKLHKCRTQVVFGRGQLPADVLFLGEAPGESEDLLGYAFVGKAGKILDKIIYAAFYNEPEYSYFITNTVGCRPTYKGKNETPAEKHIDACKERVVDTILLAQPRLVVCLGKIALSAWKKHLYKYQDKEITIPYIHLRHPAYLLRLGHTQEGTREFDASVNKLNKAIEGLA